MTSDQILGIAVLILAGLWLGCSGWYIKISRNYAYEHIGFVSFFAALIVVPWTVTLLTCPHAIDAYRSINPKVFLEGNLFSAAWGVVAILLLDCYKRIGFSLTLGVQLGVAIPIGVVTPMVFKGSGLFNSAPDLFSPAGMVVISGSVVMLVGVVLVCLSGRGRDRASSQSLTVSRNMVIGLALAALSGVLTVGSMFMFIYTHGPVVEAMKAHGASAIPANIAVWAAGGLGGGLVSVLYFAGLITKRKTWDQILAHPRDFFYCLVGGTQFCLQLVSIGKGMLLAGVLGAALGYGVSHAMQLVGGQILGFAFHEWRGITGTPRRQILWATAILVVSVCIMSAGNLFTTAPAPTLSNH